MVECLAQVFGDKHAQHFLQDKEANLLLVTLSAGAAALSAAKGKGPTTAAQRSFATLRMTARTPVK
jgi:hypothetical protein